MEQNVASAEDFGTEDIIYYEPGIFNKKPDE